MNGRDCSGKFIAGNGGGPGRPKKEVERQYLAAISDFVTVDDWREIVRRAATDAKNGDARAREWLGKFLIGEQPVEAYHQHRNVNIYIPDNRRYNPPSQPKHDGIDGDLI